MAGKLKALDAEREKKPGRYFDGDGLYLVVTGATAKNWLYRYWFNGKQRWHGLGSFKDVSLKDARAARDEARLKIKGDRNTPGVDIVGESGEFESYRDGGSRKIPWRSIEAYVQRRLREETERRERRATRATPLCEGPQSTAWRLNIRPERSMQIL